MTRAVNTARAGAGGVLQVVQAIATAPLSISTGANYNFVDITGLSVSITPISASSKILLITHISAGSVNPGNSIFRFTRDGTPVGIGTGSGYNSYGFTSYYAAVGSNYIYTNSPISGQYLDAPNTTSALTYKVQFSGDYAGAMTFNRREADTRFSTTSTLTVMEIAG